MPVLKRFMMASVESAHRFSHYKIKNPAEAQTEFVEAQQYVLKLCTQHEFKTPRCAGPDSTRVDYVRYLTETSVHGRVSGERTNAAGRILINRMVQQVVGRSSEVQSQTLGYRKPFL